MPTPTRPPTTSTPFGDGATLVVWDAAAYRRFAAAANDDPATARARALDAAAAGGRAGLTPAASPLTLWALLADLAPRAGDPAGRAHAALTACVAHTLDQTAPVDPPAGDRPLSSRL